nr:protein kinase-like domain-containing protein [Tanacetum cinerariifolium]
QAGDRYPLSIKNSHKELPIEGILKKAFSLAANEFFIAWGYEDSLMSLRNNLEMIRAMLQDAERRNATEAVKVWMKQLRDVVSEADDVFIMMMSSPNHDHLFYFKILLEDVLSATNNFADENIIGIGDFFKKYKGQLLWSGELIEIDARRFNKERNDRQQLFWIEISMLSSLKHKNLVSLVGFYDENVGTFFILLIAFNLLFDSANVDLDRQTVVTYGLLLL